MPPKPPCAIILSHPRSGTHLLLDFLRRNFPQLQRRLLPWESASGLYLSLDARDEKLCRAWLAGQHGPFIAQSHHIGFTRPASDIAFLAEAHRPVFFYPFRRFSKTAQSYADFLAQEGLWDAKRAIDDLLRQPDPFYRSGLTVEENMRAHATACETLMSAWIDMEDLQRNPDAWASSIGVLLGLTPAPLKRRLPGRKRFHGKLSELFERLRGRESTEVQIPRRTAWKDRAGADAFDSRMWDVYGLLQQRSAHLSNDPASAR